MSSSSIAVKQSKKMIIFASIAAGMFECLFITLAIFFIAKLYLSDSLTFDENIAYKLSVVIFIVYSIIIGVIWVWILLTYKFQVDVYVEDKLIRKRRGKIIFELPYENIISIREGYESVFFVLKSPIVNANGKKGAKNFYEHYASSDIVRIKQLIGIN